MSELPEKQGSNDDLATIFLGEAQSCGPRICVFIKRAGSDHAPKADVAAEQKTGMRQIFSQYDRPLVRLVRRLDDIARRLNPFLAVVIIALLILNFACAFDLIDWRNLPESTPLADRSQAAASQPVAGPSLSGAHTGSGARIATTPD